MEAPDVGLVPGETVLWTGAPTRYPFIKREDASGAVAGAWVCLFSFVIMFEVVYSIPFMIFPFAAGLYFAVIRFPVRYFALRTSQYTVTNLRIVVTTSMVGRPRQKSFYYDALMRPTVKEHANGTGTIIFTDWKKEPEEITWPRLRLVEIDNVRHVRHLIVAAQTRRDAT